MYSTKTLVNQYKTHIQSLTESTTSAIYHATTSTLKPLDRLYETFLHAIHLTQHDAFMTLPITLMYIFVFIGIVKLHLQIPWRHRPALNDDS